MIRLRPIQFTLVLMLLGLACTGYLVAASASHRMPLSAKLAAATSTTFTVPELGFQLSLPAGLASYGLQYDAQVNRPGDAAYPATWSTASFTATSLLQLDSHCTAAEGSIGIIARYTEDPKKFGADVVASVPIGPYYYGLALPQGPCSTNPQAVQLQTTLITLLSQAFQSMKGAN